MKVKLKDKIMDLKGSRPKVGELAPAFTLENLDNQAISLANLKGKKVLLSVFPDINTSVCDAQTRHFFNTASDYQDLEIINISNNTKAQLTDWCATNGIDVEMLSDTDLEFANAYGLYLSDIDALARSVFLIDENGVLIYKEVMEDLTDEPDYETLFSNVDKL